MKKKFERVFTLLLAALLVVSMAGCGGTPSEPPGEEGNDGGGETVVIRVNSAFNSATVDETANGIAALEFVDRVAERTNGAYEIKLFMDSQLGGSTDQIVGGLQTGAFEMCTKAVGDFGEFTDAFMPFNFPYLYSSPEVVHAIIDGPVGDRIRQDCIDDIGIRVLAFTELGYRHVTNSKHPIKTPDDMKGLKIRTAQVESRMAVWNALGANPTPMAFNELYMALQNGTVDAQDNNLSNALSSALYEVQEYLVPTHHMTPSMDLTMNKDKFYSMPQSYQDLLTAICEDMSAYDYDVCIAMEQYYYDSLVQEHGMQVCEITDEFLTDMQTAAAPAVESAKAAVGNDALYDTLYQLLDGGESA